MAKVFLSCGQRNGERELASEIEQMLRTEFKMECYNAAAVHGFDDVMSITDQLSKADYYLFIDFKREGGLPISVFTHQEFALARAWGITEILAFQEEGLESHGILKYVLTHPTKFDRKDLVEIVRKKVKSSWDRSYSRNLVVTRIDPEDRFIHFEDHTGQSTEKVFFVYTE